MTTHDPVTGRVFSNQVADLFEQALATSKSGKLHYYISIQFYGHKVYKCGGICPNMDHAQFYVPYFERTGPASGTDPKGHTVLIMEYVADRIAVRETADGPLYVEFCESDQTGRNPDCMTQLDLPKAAYYV